MFVLLLARGERVFTLVGAVAYRHDTSTYNPQHDQEVQDLRAILTRSTLS